MEQATKAPGKTVQQNLQEAFLEVLRLERTPVSCFLVNGVRLSGTIHAMDRYTILITNPRGGSSPQLVNKSAISTICPEGPKPGPKA